VTAIPKGPLICGMPPAQFKLLPPDEQKRLLDEEHQRLIEWQAREKGLPKANGPKK
jgi:hypothetical protein